MSCSKDGQLKWSDFYEIGKKMDAAAKGLRIDGYSPLGEDHQTPFPLPDTIPATFWQRFNVTIGTPGTKAPTITSRFMATATGDSYPLPSADTLSSLASRSDLFFVSDEDSCWCKSLFKVEKEGSGYTLVTADDGDGCCQNMEVPDVGDRLDYGQHFIPAGIVLVKQRVPGQGNPYRKTEAKCVNNGGGIILEYQGSGNEYVIVAAQRQMTGRFVWRVKSEYVSKIWDKIVQAATTASGAKSQKIKRCDSETDEFISTGCDPKPEDLMKSLKSLWGGKEEPGCLTDCKQKCLPWNQQCCGAENCEGKGLKVYCNTLQGLEDIVDNLEKSIFPYNEKTSGGVCCKSCETAASAAGGFEGFSESYKAGEGIPQECSEVVGGSVKVTLFWNHEAVPDNTCLNGNCTGMTGGQGELHATVRIGEEFTVTVKGSEEGTAWSFSTSCELTNEEPP